MNAEKSKVVKAIDSIGPSVTVSNVCQATGLAIDHCQRLLNEIAAESSGKLLVDSKGNLSYALQTNLSAWYERRSQLAKFNKPMSAVSHACGYVIRVSFGVFLIISLVVLSIVVGVPVLTLALIGSVIGFFQFNRLGGGSYSTVTSFAELLSWGWEQVFPTKGRHHSDINLDGAIDDALVSDTNTESSKGFLLHCFSFLFGDGFPNRDFEARQWQALTQVLLKNRGVLIAEQMSPYLNAAVVEESIALPVLARFNGRPEVTSTGNIVYTFEDFTKSSPAPDAEKVPQYLEARSWQFSNLPFDSMWKVWVFCTLNILGCYGLWLARALPIFAPYHVIIEAFFIYSVTLIALPVIRYLCISYLNTIIDLENEVRAAHSENLTSPSEALGLKLSEREQLIPLIALEPQGEVIYDSSRDLLEQEIGPDSLS